jgi:hypothetical protein
MGRAKPHIGGGPGLMYICYNIFSNTPPPTPKVETLATTNVETEPKIQKHRSGQIICDDFHELGCRWDVQDMDITNGNVFPDEVEADLDMLRTLVLNGVGEEVDDADVVAVDESAL